MGKRGGLRTSRRRFDGVVTRGGGRAVKTVEAGRALNRKKTKRNESRTYPPSTMFVVVVWWR